MLVHLGQLPTVCLIVHLTMIPIFYQQLITTLRPVSLLSLSLFCRRRPMPGTGYLLRHGKHASPATAMRSMESTTPTRPSAPWGAYAQLVLGPAPLRAAVGQEHRRAAAHPEEAQLDMSIERLLPQYPSSERISMLNTSAYVFRCTCNKFDLGISQAGSPRPRACRRQWRLRPRCTEHERTQNHQCRCKSRLPGAAAWRGRWR